MRLRVRVRSMEALNNALDGTIAAQRETLSKVSTRTLHLKKRQQQLHETVMGCLDEAKTIYRDLRALHEKELLAAAVIEYAGGIHESLQQMLYGEHFSRTLYDQVVEQVNATARCIALDNEETLLGLVTTYYADAGRTLQAGDFAVKREGAFVAQLLSVSEHALDTIADLEAGARKELKVYRAAQAQAKLAEARDSIDKYVHEKAVLSGRIAELRVARERVARELDGLVMERAAKESRLASIEDRMAQLPAPAPGTSMIAESLLREFIVNACWIAKQNRKEALRRAAQLVARASGWEQMKLLCSVANRCG